MEEFEAEAARSEEDEETTVVEGHGMARDVGSPTGCCDNVGHLILPETDAVSFI